MTDYQRLKDIIDDMNYMIYTRAVFSSSEFDSWYSKSEHILEEIFGFDSYEVNYFANTAYVIFMHAIDSPDDKYETACREGIIAIKEILVEYLNTLGIKI